VLFQPRRAGTPPPPPATPLGNLSEHFQPLERMMSESRSLTFLWATRAPSVLILLGVACRADCQIGASAVRLTVASAAMLACGHSDEAKFSHLQLRSDVFRRPLPCMRPHVPSHFLANPALCPGESRSCACELMFV